MPDRVAGRPVVGVSGPDRGGLIAWLMTALAVWRAGGRPLRITPARPLRERSIDALVVGGGSDVDPLHYGEEPLAPEAKNERFSLRDWLVGLPLALARVLLKDPAIFILDEATASVDPFTETLIQEGLDTIMTQRTAIVIAHRLSTVKNADRIIVMEQGEIIEAGTHDALLAQSGHYAELYNTYFRHQSLEYINEAKWRVALDPEEPASN